jgi:RNA polymerase sigma factor (sigma-70 family)
MDNPTADRNVVFETSLQVVCELRNLPGFQLLEENEFVERLYHRIQSENQLTDKNIIKNIALNIYAISLYQAVSMQDARCSRELGFHELSLYLYRMAYNFYLHQSLSPPEVVEKAQECTQFALEKIYSRLSSVRSPGGFLKWCGVILRNVCLGEVRNLKKDWSLNQTENEIEVPVDGQYSGLDFEHDRACLGMAILRLRANFQEVIRLTFFTTQENGDKLSDEEIADKLNISIGNLYTMRSRALALLKKDIKLFECIQDIL